MENKVDPKNLVLVQQTGIVVSALATMAIAGIRIFKTIKSDSAQTPTE